MLFAQGESHVVEDLLFVYRGKDFGGKGGWVRARGGYYTLREREDLHGL